MWLRKSSNAGGGPSKISTPPMCMCELSPSWCRKEASVDVRRSRCCCGIRSSRAGSVSKGQPYLPGGPREAVRRGYRVGSAAEPPMSWDFSTDPEFQEKLDWMREFVRERIWPLETLIDELGYDGLKRAVAPFAEEVRERGLWAAHLDPELGGQGCGQVDLGLMHEILGTGRIAPLAFGNAAPDSGNSEILALAG